MLLVLFIGLLLAGSFWTLLPFLGSLIWQSALAGLGLWIAGVPHPGLLTSAVSILGVAQLGPLPILAPGLRGSIGPARQGRRRSYSFGAYP